MLGRERQGGRWYGVPGVLYRSGSILRRGGRTGDET